ncbi:MAG TPA: glucose-6-phosphate dehydrogenase [Vicinamibacterales bacterium]
MFVIFGASGDLTRRKLLPAIYNLAESRHLPDQFAVLGVARPRIDAGSFRARMRERVRAAEGEPLDPDKWKRIEERLHYVSGEFDNPSLYAELRRTLEEIRPKQRTPPNYLFYLAIPPDLFATVVKQLADAGLTREDEGWRRVIIEKPFGYDLASARALNAELSAAGLRESQIYRIDHYLGKETVQNIMAFRFANGIFEPTWNRRYVDHVQMTVAEEGGVENRGAYYDRAGALRDMVQNHMFQLLTLVAMEPPISFRADDVRDEKVKVLHAVTPLDANTVRRCAVRGQYAGYRAEPDVSPTSRTETSVALKLLIDNWRWAGVPFYLRTGKRLPRRLTEIAVQFKPAPFTLFRETSVACTNPNLLMLRIQPEESICLSFDAKVPGPLERLETVNMEFSYERHFEVEPTTGYETLLFDAMTGDQMLFHRMDMVEAGWQAVQPILDAWAKDTTSPLPVYEPAAWGPAEGDLLIEQDGREWRP